MSTFRIIAEEIHKFKKHNLYVLVFKDGDNFGVDLNNGVSNFGRVVVGDKDKTKYLFSLLNEFINNQEDYLSACEFSDSILSYEDYDKILFSLHTYRRQLGKMEAYAIMHALGFEYTERIMSSGASLIRVKDKKSNDNFGEFIMISNTKKYMFHFF